MIKTLTKTVGKTTRLFVRGCRKFTSRPGEAFLLCRMAWWVGVLSLAARLRPLPRALQIVAGRKHQKQVATDDRIANQLARTIDLLLSADLFVFKPICWKRAAVLHRYLAKNGITTRIIFGVRQDRNGKVDGHAWLEAGGQPILENSPPEYVITYCFPSNQPFDTKLAFLSPE